MTTNPCSLSCCKGPQRKMTPREQEAYDAAWFRSRNPNTTRATGYHLIEERVTALEAVVERLRLLLEPVR